MRTFFLAAFSAALLFTPIFPSAQAEETQRIAAVVNEDAISEFDLNSRMRLIAYTANLRDSTEALRRMLPDILRALIDEQLKLQEAERLEITVADEELESAKRRIESRNGMPEGGLKETLDREGIAASTITTQIRSSLAWEKIIRNRLYPKVIVSDDEVEEKVARLQQFADAPEYLVSEIFLAVDDTTQETAVRETVQRVANEARASNNFARFARQFSQGVTALSGGELGWIRQGQLGNELNQAIQEMKLDAVSEPIRTEDGYYLLWLQDRRKVGETSARDTIGLSQLLFPLSPKADPNEITTQISKAENERTKLSGCLAMNRAAELSGAPMSGSLGTIKLKDLAAKLRNAVQTLPIGVPSKPVHTEAGIHLLMVCDRPNATTPIDDRQQVRLNIMLEKLDLLSRRYLRDLRRTAFVDIRL
ncbi:MAG: hypothetical protein COA65_01020 [Rhodospirillaceae bacterium]|nr:MAG: hypothetical protein COA65_01020 [Rhodospirillaceae bacterium]